MRSAREMLKNSRGGGGGTTRNKLVRLFLKDGADNPLDDRLDRLGTSIIARGSAGKPKQDVEGPIYLLMLSTQRDEKRVK